MEIIFYILIIVVLCFFLYPKIRSVLQNVSIVTGAASLRKKGVDQFEKLDKNDKIARVGIPPRDFLKEPIKQAIMNEKSSMPQAFAYVDVIRVSKKNTVADQLSSISQRKFGLSENFDVAVLSDDLLIIYDIEKETYESIDLEKIEHVTVEDLPVKRRDYKEGFLELLPFALKHYKATFETQDADISISFYNYSNPFKMVFDKTGVGSEEQVMNANLQNYITGNYFIYQLTKMFPTIKVQHTIS